jgi:electron transfer flavoprotein alpha/beta subunit
MPIPDRHAPFVREADEAVYIGPPVSSASFSAAVEAGLQIREKAGGTVTAITMGPPQAEQALRETLSMGADDAG